ncbi:MAG: hypothetical protein ACLQCU_05230 [Acidimicrobiales bacterium]|jgi:hypothetical protein
MIHQEAAAKFHGARVNLAATSSSRTLCAKPELVTLEGHLFEGPAGLTTRLCRAQPLQLALTLLVNCASWHRVRLPESR